MSINVKRGKKKIRAFISLAVIAGMLGGCALPSAGPDENLLGIRSTDEGKQVITITCNLELSNFAAAVEERFPDIRLVRDGYMGQYRNSEHVARIRNRDIGDIIMVKAGHIPKVDMSGLLLDLSPQAFPAQFNKNALQSDEDGRITLIPGPLNFNCNMYNKTLFEENHWEVPENYEELLELCREIDNTGIRGYRNSYYDSASQSYQIYNYCVISALDTLTQVDGQIWHHKLMAGEKVSLEPMAAAFQDMRRMMEAGAVREEDLDISVNRNMDALVNREVAISEGEVNRLDKLNGSGTDEFSFMPHFSMTDGQGWLLNLGFYFGVNKELGQPENEKKLEAVMDIMDFIATEEGQNLLMEDGMGMISAIRGTKIPDNPVMENIRTQIESGRYVMRPTFDMFSSVLETEIAAFIRGETDSAAILEMCGRILEEGPPPVPALGEAEADFTVWQTGCLKADALRTAAGTDIALLGVSEADCYDPVGGTRAKLYKGKITEDDITRIAQIQIDTPVMCYRASVTGEELLSLLEYGATSEEEQEKGAVSHYHPFAVSGLKLSYRLSKEEGRRVSGITLEDGRKLQPDSEYTISFLQGAFPQEKLDGAETGITMTDALRDYITEKEKLIPGKKLVKFGY